MIIRKKGVHGLPRDFAKGDMLLGLRDEVLSVYKSKTGATAARLYQLL